jgi:hypothetical protein
LKGDLIFADEEGVPRGHSQALTLVPLGYFFEGFMLLKSKSVKLMKVWK